VHAHMKRPDETVRMKQLWCNYQLRVHTGSGTGQNYRYQHHVIPPGMLWIWRCIRGPRVAQ
jgi:hypothetical protein